MLPRLSLFIKRFASLLISMSVAFSFVVIHITIESDAFEHGPFSKNGLVHLLDLKALDVKLTTRSTDDLPEPHVVVAAIDERSVERFGLWPWSRSVVAELIRAAGRYDAKVLAFDAVFSDEDKNSSYVSIKKFLDAFQAQQLNIDSERLKTLMSQVSQAERLESESKAALAQLRRKAQSDGKPALVAAVRQAEQLHTRHARHLEGARKALSEWALQSEEFYTLLQKEVAAISPDEDLAKAIAEHADNVVLGYINFYNDAEVVGVEGVDATRGFEQMRSVAINNIFEYTYQDVGGQVMEMLRPVPHIKLADLEISKAVATRANMPAFTQAANYYGYFNKPPDRDGPMRRTRTLNKFGDQLFPSLSLLTAARYFDADIRPIAGEIKPGKTIDGFHPFDANSDERVPTDMHGRMLINYYTAPEDYFPTYSVADFIDGTVPKEAVAGKVVLFGMTAQGLFDLRPTPFSPNTPGVYIHAQAVQNIIDGRHLQRWFGLALIEALGYLLLGLLIGLAVPRLPAWAGLLGTLGLAAGMYWIDMAFIFPQGVWMLNVLPTGQAVISFLGVSVYGYLTEGREKRQIRKAFQFYLTKSVVDEMLKDPSKLQLGGEKRTCTVLFSDIRGFTTISERLSPEELVALLNEYLTPMTDLVFQYEGTLDKYMGDAIMAIFGAPVEQKDHATRACIVSIKMLEALAELQVGWRERGLPELDIGIGLNTGPMSVGNMGSAIRFDYTVMGDHVNLGSRLEGINKTYGTNIIISEYTYEAAQADIVAREMDSVRVKGKKEPVKIYELLGYGEDSSTKFAPLVQQFEHGIALYKAQKWDEAIATFHHVRSEIRENDFASGMYIERCEAMRANPPGADWDGVFTMTTK